MSTRKMKTQKSDVEAKSALAGAERTLTDRSDREKEGDSDTQQRRRTRRRRNDVVDAVCSSLPPNQLQSRVRTSDLCISAVALSPAFSPPSPRRRRLTVDLLLSTSLRLDGAATEREEEGS